MPARSRVRFFLLISSLALARVAHPQATDLPLLAGPMIAGVRPTEALLWVQLQANQPAWVIAQDTAHHQSLIQAEFSSPDPATGVARCRLTGLQPATTYHYYIRLRDAVKALASGRFQTPPTDSVAAELTFALGSCAFVDDPYPAAGYPIFEQIRRQHPDLMLWLGDNVYLRDGEWNDSAAAARRYAHTRALPGLQPLLAQATHVAIWDDHDFGPNDADSTLPLRAAMLRLFRQFWPHDLYAAPPGGATGHFRWGDAEFFLLDDRYWRTPDKLLTFRARSQLGAAQRAWLVAGLLASTATFKFVAVGGQFLTTYGHGESFANGFKRERRRLLRALDAGQIRNVIFLTGDRHYAELSVRRPRNAPAQYDLTASPFTAGPARPKRNRRTVPGTVIRGHNFATVRLSGPRRARQVTFAGFSATGERRWERTIAAE